ARRPCGGTPVWGNLSRIKPSGPGTVASRYNACRVNQTHELDPINNRQGLRSVARDPDGKLGKRINRRQLLKPDWTPMGKCLITGLEGELHDTARPPHASGGLAAFLWSPRTQPGARSEARAGHYRN